MIDLGLLEPVSTTPGLPTGGDGPVREGFAKYIPANYDRRFHGTLPLKMVMGNSLNIPALKVELRTGIPRRGRHGVTPGLTCSANLLVEAGRVRDEPHPPRYPVRPGGIWHRRLTLATLACVTVRRRSSTSRTGSDTMSSPTIPPRTSTGP